MVRLVRLIIVAGIRVVGDVNELNLSQCKSTLYSFSNIIIVVIVVVATTTTICSQGSGISASGTTLGQGPHDCAPSQHRMPRLFSNDHGQHLPNVRLLCLSKL